MAQILEDDGYLEVPPDDVKPGDVVVYYGTVQLGEIIHTGVVARVDKVPMLGVVPHVLSKWGRAGEYVHPVRVYPQRYSRFAYFREDQTKEVTA